MIEKYTIYPCELGDDDSIAGSGMVRVRRRHGLWDVVGMMASRARGARWCGSTVLRARERRGVHSVTGLGRSLRAR
jgi:hypothetical protein